MLTTSAQTFRYEKEKEGKKSALQVTIHCVCQIRKEIVHCTKESVLFKLFEQENDTKLQFFLVIFDRE